MNPDQRNGNETISVQNYADAEHQLAECTQCGTYVRAPVHSTITFNLICGNPHNSMKNCKPRMEGKD